MVYIEVYIYTLYINVYNVYMYLGKGNFRYLIISSWPKKNFRADEVTSYMDTHTHFVWSYFVWCVQIDTPGRFKLSAQLSCLCLHHQWLRFGVIWREILTDYFFLSRSPSLVGWLYFPWSHVYSHKFWLKVTLPHPTSHPQPQPTTSNHNQP